MALTELELLLARLNLPASTPPAKLLSILHSAQQQPAEPASLSTLPSELLSSILTHLPQSSLRALHLTSSHLCAHATAHLFHSVRIASPADIPLLHHIAHQPRSSVARAVRDLHVALAGFPAGAEDEVDDLLRRALPGLRKLRAFAYTCAGKAQTLGDEEWSLFLKTGETPRRAAEDGVPVGLVDLLGDRVQCLELSVSSDFDGLDTARFAQLRHLTLRAAPSFHAPSSPSSPLLASLARLPSTLETLHLPLPLPALSLPPLPHLTSLHLSDAPLPPLPHTLRSLTLHHVHLPPPSTHLPALHTLSLAAPSSELDAPEALALIRRHASALTRVALPPLSKAGLVGPEQLAGVLRACDRVSALRMRVDEGGREWVDAVARACGERLESLAWHCDAFEASVGEGVDAPLPYSCFPNLKHYIHDVHEDSSATPTSSSTAAHLCAALPALEAVYVAGLSADEDVDARLERAFEWDGGADVWRARCVY